MSKSNNRKQLLAGGIIALRFIQSPFVFLAPITMSILSVILDLVDSGILFGLGFSRRFYHHWDKLGDFFWYCCILAYIIFSPTTLLLQSIFIFLFAVRSLGLLLSYIKQNRRFLFYFPNVFECFFLFYLISLKTNPNWLELPSIFQALVIITFLKLIHEYYMHIKKIFYEFRLWPLIVNQFKN